MVVLPAATPLTRPVLLFTVAAAGLLLVQLPPAVPLVRVMVLLAHTSLSPPMAGNTGNAFTVMAALVTEILQPSALVISTVTDCPLVSTAVVNVLEGPFWYDVDPILKS